MALGATILGKHDNLEVEVVKFQQTPLSAPVYLNSVPKAGTHLIRNIFRMFTPVEQHYRRDFIQIPNLQLHLRAFDPKAPMLSWGHLLFSDDSAIAMMPVRHFVLVRDPYSWVLARARFYLSGEFQGSLNHIKGGAVTAADVINMMILGVHRKAPSLLDLYTFNAAAWVGTAAKMIRYEDILHHLKALETDAAEAFFADLLGHAGIALPADWRERVRIGSDPGHSRTARENLTGVIELPAELTQEQKNLVDFSAPGLRKLLGYA
ncbi:MAG TPA: hypothetical protein VD929_02210 [Caulobacteraceae bacterium]|nr:hypothetical protein [Caulobacteraceae bacterium]